MKKHTTKTQWTPAAWQIDPSKIETPNGKCQYWHNGGMVTAQMTVETARELVAEGKAFVITSQAIGALENGQPNC